MSDTESLGSFMREDVTLRYIRPIEHPVTGWRVGWLAERFVGDAVDPETADADGTAIVCERRRHDHPRYPETQPAHYYRTESSWGFSAETLREFRSRGADRLYVLEVDTEDVHEFMLAQFTGANAIVVKNRKGKGNRIDYQRHVPSAHAHAHYTRQEVHVYSRGYKRKWRPGQRPEDYPDDWDWTPGQR